MILDVQNKKSYAYTIASGRCKPATSRITASACWRSTCPVTIAAPARRSPISP
jgi:hypothetical protein